MSETNQRIHRKYAHVSDPRSNQIYPSIRPSIHPSIHRPSRQWTRRHHHRNCSQMTKPSAPRHTVHDDFSIYSPQRVCRTESRRFVTPPCGRPAWRSKNGVLTFAASCAAFFLPNRLSQKNSFSVPDFLSKTFLMFIRFRLPVIAVVYIYAPTVTSSSAKLARTIYVILSMTIHMISARTGSLCGDSLMAGRKANGEVGMARRP
jgi:hypothetical protein